MQAYKPKYKKDTTINILYMLDDTLDRKHKWWTDRQIFCLDHQEGNNVANIVTIY